VAGRPADRDHRRLPGRQRPRPAGAAHGAGAREAARDEGELGRQQPHRRRRRDRARRARRRRDGYTIGTLTTPSFIIIPLVKKPQYDPAAILPLARVVDDPTLVVAGGASSLHDLKRLVARAQASPGSVAMGHNGVGTNGHLAALAIEVAAGAKLNDIPFKGTSESRTALLGGHVDIVGMSVSEFVMDREAVGLFKGLAQLAPVRAAALPEVPTAKEPASTS
jgi:tripartite-type tricarboxylate transporter receptor subunit TctC